MTNRAKTCPIWMHKPDLGKTAQCGQPVHQNETVCTDHRLAYLKSLTKD